MSPRWYDKRTGDNLAMDTGGGALARLWATALANKVHIAVRQRDRHERADQRCPRRRTRPRSNLEWKIPQWSNAIERDRARIYFVAYAAGCALHFLDKAFEEIRAGRTKTFEDFDVPDEAIGCGFHEAVRGVLSHHIVIRDGKIANYHPYPPTPWNGSPTDSYGTPGPYEDAVQRHADLRGGRRRRTSAASTSCARSAASTRACRAACTCTSATARRSSRCTRRCSESTRMIERGPQRARCSTERRGRCPIAAARDTASSSSQALLDMYGEGLRGSSDRRRRDDDGGCRRWRRRARRAPAAAARPAPGAARATRVRGALDEVRPYLESHGGDVELLGIDDGVVRLRAARAAATAARRRR